ncbi:hypothetical protein ACFYTG_32335 [Streptomyces mirabilis]|uniref:hypothetical protein n=1 Tax=Streptomyces mirabilis TaxID=68239 RepID=UPI0036BE87E3
MTAGLEGARKAPSDRPVPIPPVLIVILLAHLKEFGTAKEGRVPPHDHRLSHSRTPWKRPTFTPALEPP